MPLPAAVQKPAVLNSIAAGSRTLAWAVGTENLSGTARPLLLSWDGQRWIKDAVPGNPRSGEFVYVSSSTPETAWALGYVGSGAANVVVRWRAHAWAEVTLPGNLRYQTVYSVAAGTGRTAWLYGYTDARGYLLERWSGSRWQTIKVPYGLGGDVADMVATGSDDVWLKDSTAQGNSVIARYNAGGWTSIPPMSGGVTFISAFLPASPRSVWLTGALCTAAQPEQGCTASKPLIAQWNGSAWDRVVFPKGAALITSISAGRDAQPQWAGVSASGTRQALPYAHFDGQIWSVETAGAAVRGVVATSTLVAAIPGTNATWAATDSQTSESAPGVAGIAVNPGR